MGIELQIKKGSGKKGAPEFYVKATKNQSTECTFVGNPQEVKLTKALEKGWSSAPDSKGRLTLGKGFYTFGGFREEGKLYPKVRILVDQFGDLWVFPTSKHLAKLVEEVSHLGEVTISYYAVFYREIAHSSDVLPKHLSGVIPWYLLNSIALEDELEFQNNLIQQPSYNERRLDARIPAIKFLAQPKKTPLELTPCLSS
jgi:hypothetical protein